SVVNVALSAWFVDVQYGTAIWPTTGEMLISVINGSYLFIVILTTIYAGELAWRERQLRVAGITDALPVPTGLVMTGKLLAFLGAMAIVELCGVGATMAVQTIKGYHHYQLGLYANGVLWIGFPIIVELAALAFIVHAIVNSKFVGHVIMIVYFVATLVLNTLGFQRLIYQYGVPITYTYSDMNHFGQYEGVLSGVMVYYVLLGIVLLIVAYLFWPRGADETWAARWATVRARAGASSTRALGGIAALATVAAGGFVWYNTSVLNPYHNSKATEHLQADYERDYRRYRTLETPRIVGVHIQADLVPERRAFSLASVYRVVNKRQRPLDSLYVSITNTAFLNAVTGAASASHGYRVDSIVWSRPTSVLFSDTARGVYLYRLAQPLAPGDTITLAYGAHYTTAGYPNGTPNNDIVANGTFLNQSYFPSLAYDESPELNDDDTRKREHLQPKDRQPSIHDESARQNSALSNDADWVTFDAEVSTAPDQIAIAPGYLRRDTVENGRRHFTYAMDRPILNFYSILSARYAVRRDSANGVSLEIYYNPGHVYDLDRMIEGSKRGLAYFTTHFSPYQFRQYRIIEFPRYRSFAQSFPNTIPFSEGIGFVARVRDSDDDLDWPLFVTAHELAHQWWGHQIIPANQQGASMLIESLAEYSALTIMEQKYGQASAQKFLRYELDRYLRGRSTERKKEMPLMLVENQQYIHYNKGSLVFFALRDYIGEDSLNSALHRFLHDKAFQNPPYTNTVEFLPYVKAVTPDSLQYVIHDLFETITLYDNKATAATAKRRADGQYDVHLTFDAKKLRADSLGGQTEIPIADYIDVGVFGEPSKGNKLGKPLAVRKVHVTQPTMTVDFVVRELPLKAGIDPFNKLIDRTPEDNVRPVDIGP
ncbi:MAG TPA: M1 family aminopeptidase, partial [Gemmatimonadaceae bacterium]|nr:M1 family aminopeptidase [Gemmatimonadaceae bacterium]